jgi:hypothetical protein
MQDLSECWIERNLQSAASQGFHDPCEVLVSREGVRLLKAISEISYFSLYGSFAVSSDFIRFVREFIEPIITHRSFFSIMRFNTDFSTLFLSLLEVGCAFDLIGNTNNAHVGKLCKLYGVMGPERLPFRQLDLQFGLANLGYPTAPEIRMSSIKLSCLASSSRLLNIRPVDAYALTHNIFYATDFGRNPNAIDKPILGDLLFAMKRLCHIASSQNNMDLLAEYILCFGYLNAIDDDVIDLIHLLKEKKNADGSWSGPINIEPALIDENITSELHAFYSNYHTTILCWQAEKLLCGNKLSKVRDPAPLRFQCLSGESAFWTNIYEEIEMLLMRGEQSSEFAFVIWVASRLKLGFEDIIGGITNRVMTIGEETYSFELDKLRFISGVSMASYKTDYKDGNIHTIDDFWRFAFYLSNCNDQQKAGHIRRRLSLEHERNRGLYVRLLALGISWNVLCQDDIIRETYYLDSLYAPDGVFLWQESVPEDVTRYAVPSLLGKAILNRYKQKNNYA